MNFLKSGSLMELKQKASLKRRWDGAIKTNTRKLKPAIWSRTPLDIQLRLLSFLPLTSLCRFRSVSKSWQSIITTTTTPDSSNSYLAITEVRCNVQIRVGSSWKEFTFPTTPKESVFYVSTSAGLVLAIHSDIAEYCWLSVHNPFVPGCSRVLGALPEVDDSSLVAFAGIQALTSVGDKLPFAVVCLTCRKRVLLHVFDSRSWSWVLMSAQIPGLGGWDAEEDVYHGTRNHNSFLLHDQVLYFLTVSRSNTRSLKSVSIWDPEHSCKTLATWTDLPLNLHQNCFDRIHFHNHPSLIVCQGKLMLVNTIPSGPWGALGFVYLDEESHSWRELMSFRMDAFPQKVRKKNVKEGDLRVPVWAWGRPESSKVSLYFRDSGWGCIFDVADSTWRAAFPVKAEMFIPFFPSFRTF